MWNTLLVSDQQMRWNTEVSAAQLCLAVGLIVTSSQDSVSCLWTWPLPVYELTPERRGTGGCSVSHVSNNLTLTWSQDSLLAALQRFSEDSIHKIQTVQRNLELQKLKSVGLGDFFVSFYFLFFPWSGAVRLELNWENMNGVWSMFAETLGRVPSGHMA